MHLMLSWNRLIVKTGNSYAVNANHHRFQSLENELSVRVGMLWDVLQLRGSTGLSRYWSNGTDYNHTYTNWYYELEALQHQFKAGQAASPLYGKQPWTGYVQYRYRRLPDKYGMH